MDARPLVVIIGPTASGKSRLAIELAKKFNGEIICADSRTVYTGMDIGTAKPTMAERNGIKHHILDVVEPDQDFSAARFKELALAEISAIGERGKLPIMVGGSGLYIDAVIFDYQFGELADPVLRNELNTLSVEQLQKRVQDLGLQLPENKMNPRHLIRTIETSGKKPRQNPLRLNTLVVGLRPDRNVLKGRIIKRVDEMLEAGFIDELNGLVEKYGWDVSAMHQTGYTAFRDHLNGTITLDQAKALFIQNDMWLAKRQLTWFKRNNSIQWASNRGDIVEIVTTFLNKNDGN